MTQSEPQTPRFAQPTASDALSASFAEAGKKRVADMFKLQAEFSKFLQEANQNWFAHLKSETSAASQFAAELAAARSLPETAKAWEQWATRRMELFTAESKELFAEAEKFMATGARMFGNGRSAND
jgi:Phasin protein